MALPTAVDSNIWVAASWWSDAISDITALAVLLNIECIVSINSMLLLHDAVSSGSDRHEMLLEHRFLHGFLCVRVTQVYTAVL